MVSSIQLQKIQNLGVGFFEKWRVKLSPAFFLYRPKYLFYIETTHYRLTVAKKNQDFLQLFKLRYQTFLNDDGPVEEYQMDYDEHDPICDHVMIIDKRTQEVVGTYRMLASDVGGIFYSETEFFMEEFSSLPGKKLELGRACIDPHHRNGQVLDLLWRGIAEYSRRSGARYLFGCSSVKSESLHVASGLATYFRKKLKKNGPNQGTMILNNVVPKSRFYCDVNSELVGIDKLVKSHLPPLLKSYMMAGAKVCPHPAYDRDFKCFDFLTVLDLEEISSAYHKRYFKICGEQEREEKKGA